MTAPRRPRLWIHRTRRFWFGLALILLLTGYTLVTSIYRTQFRYQQTRASGSGVIQSNVDLSLESGGIRVFRQRTILAAGFGHYAPPEWSVQTSKLYGFEAWPSLRSKEGSNPWGTTRTRFEGFVPVWPLVVALFFLWPLYLHRADRKEALRLANRYTPPARLGADPA